MITDSNSAIHDTDELFIPDMWISGFTEIGNVAGRSVPEFTVLLTTTARKLGLVEAVDDVLVQDDETFRRNMCLVKTEFSSLVRSMVFLAWFEQ